MKYIYYNDSLGNFGDDLNPWLWPLIFNKKNNLSSDISFLGIGSILFPDNKLIIESRDKRKIVFGTGVRPTCDFSQISLDDTWDIRFLRGPLSSLTLDNAKYITDAAYAIRLSPIYKDLSKVKKKYEISIMPYFKSFNFLNWEEIALELGLHYISPHSEYGVEHTLKEIAESKFLITEAMHGAIVADLLRVPWHRFILSTPYREGAMVTNFKWTDWLSSIHLSVKKTTFIPSFNKTKINKGLDRLFPGYLDSFFLSEKRTKENIFNEISKIEEYFLSDDSMISMIDNKLYSEIQEISRLEY